jgi:pilus assembly protein Flp/PilA
VLPNMFRKICRFLRSEDGPTGVEYCVMLMLIILTLLTVIQLFGHQTSDSFDKTSEQLKKTLNG